MFVRVVVKITGFVIRVARVYRVILGHSVVYYYCVLCFITLIPFC